ncbi:hypothetical protein RirG_084810 [Rhizophagus irregularis DAOM 197198w]|uniref:Uncharacterized protein n=1 Tax=Rhizophagus irregularis (strain DAOM 197198w) TaxID=1432141 RepID=A0A015JMK8_RHIIW|nr:hypothetical protein RirG_084810 [Rhizophagus irregularis DAOM 197198w]
MVCLTSNPKEFVEFVKYCVEGVIESGGVKYLESGGMEFVETMSLVLDSDRVEFVGNWEMLLDK